MTTRSTFTLLFPMLATLVAAPVAQADLQNVPAVINNPVPPGHEGHSRCHPGDNPPLNKQLDNDPYCGPIRSKERGDFTTAYKSQPKNGLVDADGKYFNGARTVFDRNKISGTTSEPTFTAKAWLNRFKAPVSSYGFLLPTFTSAHPEWDTTGAPNTTIDDCNEYVYKRYYSANRYLDTLGQLVGQRRYDDALTAILDSGIPSVNGTRSVPPLENNYLRDYDGRATTTFSPIFNNYDYTLIKPLWTMPATRNPFFGAPFYLELKTPPDGTQYDSDFRAAFTKANAELPQPADPHGEFGIARTRRNYEDIKKLTVGEREDIARREREYINAVDTAAHHFNQCLIREWISISAVAPTLSGKNAAEVLEFLEANQASTGYTYPVDQFELQLQAQLLNPATASSTASNVVLASLDGTSLISQMARTRTGSLLRLINGLDKTAMQTAITAATSFTAKSGAFDTSGACSLGDDFQRVRDLMVAEWNRPDHGCYSSNTQKCDFSAPLFIDGIAERLVDEIRDADDAKAQCVKTLGSGSFDSWLSKVDPAYRTSLSVFEGRLKTKYQEIAALLRDAPRSSSLPHSIGDRRDGGSDWGDGTFGAGYHYSGEWGINVVDSNKDGACQLGGKVSGSLTAYATAFTARQELVDAGLTAVTQQPNASGVLQAAQFQAHVKLLGFDIFTPVSESSVSPSYTKRDDGHQEIDIIKTTVFIGPVPVSISVGFQFDYGYTLDLRFQQTSVCGALAGTNAVPSLSVNGNVTPHAGASAVVSAYVDLFIAGAGVKGKLTLVDAQLPFNASVRTQLDPHDGFEVITNSSVKLILTELSGSLSFIVNLLGITVWEAEFFSWDGFHQTINLWNDDETYPINVFNSL